jgi:hypothetical protein
MTGADLSWPVVMPRPGTTPGTFLACGVSADLYPNPLTRGYHHA